MEVETSLFSITCLFKNAEDGFQWAFIGVYGSIEKNKRNFFGKSWGL